MVKIPLISRRPSSDPLLSDHQTPKIPGSVEFKCLVTDYEQINRLGVLTLLEIAQVQEIEVLTVLDINQGTTMKSPFPSLCKLLTDVIYHHFANQNLFLRKALLVHFFLNFLFFWGHTALKRFRHFESFLGFLSTALTPIFADFMAETLNIMRCLGLLLENPKLPLFWCT